MRLDIKLGNSPLLLAQPHGGVEIPKAIYARLNATGRLVADTDWHISRLYANLVKDVTTVATPIHRYVIDANRDPDDVTLYPGLNTTSLCPTTDFAGESIYLTGQTPSSDEISQRCLTYHQPYHQALSEQLVRLQQKHGYVVLYDCHSIRSELPFLFKGKLPDLSLGTNNSTSCSSQLQVAVEDILRRQDRYSWVSNDRFKGGWTTRHYGNPDRNFHAIQMEITQNCYMRESTPWTYNPPNAESLGKTLAQILKLLAK